MHSHKFLRIVNFAFADDQNVGSFYYHNLYAEDLIFVDDLDDNLRISFFAFVDDKL